MHNVSTHQLPGYYQSQQTGVQLAYYDVTVQHIGHYTMRTHQREKGGICLMAYQPS